MEETAQNFEKQFFINRSYIFISLPKFYVTHQIYEILSKSLVPTGDTVSHVGIYDPSYELAALKPSHWFTYPPPPFWAIMQCVTGGGMGSGALDK